MKNIMIQVEGLSKQYRIGIAKQRYDTLRDQIASSFKRLFQLNGRGSSTNRSSDSFWALKDVSFEVKQGEVLGIIGRNGAGKSTLLKILSRITEPTEGRAHIYGRLACLLEVGTGFHRELTGRENIYLNGAILGMKRTEIERKFDEIVDFSGVEKFIDTPVKHYSSGMYVRLAFAVAAHLEPDVLIVDEVLAVGDAGFQAKCLGKMESVAREGRTVLFVSHNMAAIENLCDRVILLDMGKVAFEGPSGEAIPFFLSSMPEKGSNSRSHIVDLRNHAGRAPKYRPILTSMELYGESNRPLVNGSLKLGGPLKVRLSFHLEDPAPNLDLTLGFETQLGQCILLISSTYQSDPPTGNRTGDRTFVCDIPSLPLLPAEYKIAALVDINGSNVDRVVDAARITVVASDYYGGGRLPHHGFVAVKHRWHETQSDSRAKPLASAGGQHS
jgi:lipopolysaccharide transport system ATP-binding protein